MTRRAAVWGCWLAAAVASCLLPLAVRAEDRLAQIRSDFERESDPVRKAKLAPKLGDALFAAADRRLADGDYAEALRALREYRDAVRSVIAALKSTGRDAERKPAGFKQLQMHLRKSIRRLDDIVRALPDDEQENFRALGGDFVAADKELFNLLFPRQPGKEPEKDRPKG